MIITGKIVSIDLNATITKASGGTYKGAEIVFKDANGKVQTKNIHENGLKYAPAVKNGLESLEPGDNFTVEMEKKDDFWTWVSIKKGIEQEKNQNTTLQQSTASKSTSWETAEERSMRRDLDKKKFDFEKAKQKLIVRQNSLTNAVAFLAIQPGTISITEEDVLETATTFYNWVFEQRVDENTEDDFNDGVL